MADCPDCSQSKFFCVCNVPDGTRRGTLRDKSIVKKSRKPSRTKGMLYAQQAFRSILKRKGMSDTITLMMESNILEDRGPAYFMHKARQLLKREQNSSFKLKDNNVARCHIVADSNVRVIVEEIYVVLKKLHASSSAPVASSIPNDIRNFVVAMAAEQQAGRILTMIEADILKSEKRNQETVMHELSHGACNLYFGDAERNTQILHGLDVPLEGGKPSANAANIINALVALRISFDTKAVALQPTRHEKDGMAVSSYTTAAYDPATRFDAPRPQLQRRNSL